MQGIAGPEKGLQFTGMPCRSQHATCCVSFLHVTVHHTLLCNVLGYGCLASQRDVIRLCADTTVAVSRL